MSMAKSRPENNPGMLWQLKGLMVLLVVALLSSNASAALMLQDANFVALPGKKIELRFDFDAPPPVPKSYKISQPARTVLDLWGTENDLGIKALDVNAGTVKKVNFAQTPGRLRIVTELTEASDFKISAEGNSLFVVFFAGGAEKVAASGRVIKEEKPKLARNAPLPLNSDQTRVSGIDFERIDGGLGRVVISLSDDDAGLDIIEEGNNVVVNLLGAHLSRALEKRIDVQDFATPVMFIDAMADGENTTLLVKPGAAPYEYMAYQAGTRLVLDFKPLTLAEKEEREQELFPFQGEPIDLNFQDIELRAVLQIIAETAELNLVVSDQVSGSITLRLKNVPWDQALDIILKTKDLDKRIMGNVLLVAPAAEIADRERQELESSKKIEELAPLLTEFVQVDYRKASEMKSRLQEARLVSERGFIMADDETNVLMVRESERAISEIRRTLKRFDVEVQQVLIEARLVTARANVTKDLGIKWGLGYEDVDGGSGLIVNNEIGGINFATPPTDAGLMVDLGATATNPTSFAIGFKPGSSAILGLELSALETDGKAEIISQPKIVTTNGKAARIESGREIPFQTVEDGEVKIEFKDVVLSLDVTPRINPGERIAMELKIKQDSLGEVLPTGNISIDNNELETSVVVPDGQTIVLGGVFKNETSTTVNKTPLLGDLPVLGNLFRNTENSSSKTELLIFITPKMVRESLSIN